ncbi:MAG: signal peptidase I [Streptosporangiales bacterium]|nr:signal peptidase I [Streptosporangiales bacterium]
MEGGRHRRPGRHRHKPERREEGIGSFFKELPVLVVAALALALIIKAFLVQAFYIPSQSMENTLMVGDRVLVNKVVYRFGPIQRGDIVVFNGLDSFTPEVPYEEPSNPVQRVLRSVGSAFGVAPPGEKDFIKRVIGVPGDHVACCDSQGRVTVNNVPLEEQDYLYRNTEGELDDPSEQEFDVTVPDGRLWVMGDHRSVSADSRAHVSEQGGGTVPADKVIGRAFVIVWPASRAGALPSPETFEQPSLAAGAAALAPDALGFACAVPVAMALGRLRRRRSHAEACPTVRPNHGAYRCPR